MISSFPCTSPASDPQNFGDLNRHAGNSGIDSIWVANPIKDKDWDENLIKCGFNSFFHGSAWARVLQDTYGFNPIYLASGRSDRLTSVLPLMEVDSWLTGRRGVSLPFADQCEPLFTELSSLQGLLQIALKHAKERGWKYMEVRGGRQLFGGTPDSLSYLGHRLDLKHSEAELFARFDGSVRRAIHKAERSGLTIEFSQDLEAVHAFHRLLCGTRKRHGSLPQPVAFFDNIQRHILAKNQGWVVLARIGQIPVAGAVFFHFGNTAMFKFGASDIRYQSLRPNNLVMWEAIKRYARQGTGVLEFGRTSLGNAGLRRFKLGWGASEYPIDYVKFGLKDGSSVPSRDESDRWFSQVFKIIPLPLSRLAGLTLYKHIA
jgi:hypothetical protein